MVSNGGLRLNVHLPLFVAEQRSLRRKEGEDCLRAVGPDAFANSGSPRRKGVAQGTP